MRMMMRLQPSQIVKEYKFTTAGGASLKLGFAKQAGLTNYDCILVGASGAKSGQAKNYNGGKSSGRGGGGGGGSLRLQGFIKDLPDLVALVVGDQGTAGANGGNNSKAPNGGDGGTTTFHIYSAFGGKGSIGGDWDGDADDGNFTGAVGGAGGGNSAGLGSGGAGGDVGTYIYSSHSSSDQFGFTGATTGNWEAGGSYPVVGGGRGGGGGRPGFPGNFELSTGGSGGNTGLMYQAGSARSGNDGGYGGGADVGSIMGAASEYYGGNIAGGHADGVVWIKLS